MESTYVSLAHEEIDFSPLQEKIFTIKKFKIHSLWTGDNMVTLHATINAYLVKVRLIDAGKIVEGACDCKDFILKKKKQKVFCKHILYLIDFLHSKK